MTVAEILGKKGTAVATISASAPVSEAVDLLAEHNYGALVALDEDKTVVGILSERDVVAGLARSRGEVLAQPVAKIMTADPLTCTLDGAVGEVLQMMVGWNIRHLPVIENRVLLGLVSMGDLVRRTIDSGIFDSLILDQSAELEDDLDWRNTTLDADIA